MSLLVSDCGSIARVALTLSRHRSQRTVLSTAHRCLNLTSTRSPVQCVTSSTYRKNSIGGRPVQLGGALLSQHCNPMVTSWRVLGSEGHLCMPGHQHFLGGGSVGQPGACTDRQKVCGPVPPASYNLYLAHLQSHARGCARSSRPPSSEWARRRPCWWLWYRSSCLAPRGWQRRAVLPSCLVNIFRACGLVGSHGYLHACMPGVQRLRYETCAEPRSLTVGQLLPTQYCVP